MFAQRGNLRSGDAGTGTKPSCRKKPRSGNSRPDRRTGRPAGSNAKAC